VESARVGRRRALADYAGLAAEVFAAIMIGLMIMILMVML